MVGSAALLRLGQNDPCLVRPIMAPRQTIPFFSLSLLCPTRGEGRGMTTKKPTPFQNHNDVTGRNEFGNTPQLEVRPFDRVRKDQGG